MRKLVPKFWRPARLLFVVLAMLLTSSVFASHFRYGNISWRRVSGNTIEFKISQAWRYTAFNAGVGQTVIPDNFYFGDGQGVNINLLVTSVNIAEDWLYGEFTVQHTYANAGTFDAYFNSSAKIGNLVNNANGAWNVHSKVTVGINNNSPVSTLPPIVNMPIGVANGTFSIPVNDPDGDAVTYRLATPAEISGTQPVGFSVNATTGVATFSTTSASVGQLYNAQVIMTDTKGATTAVDFIIRITQQSTPPFFNYVTTPSNGTVYQVSPGQNVNFTVKASDSDPGDIVTLQAVGLPSGASISPTLPLNGNPVQTSFSWTPGANNFGTYVINFIAQDRQGVQATTIVTIVVSLKPVFDVPPTPVAGSFVYVLSGSNVAQPIQASDPDPLDKVKIIAATLPGGASLSAPLPTTLGNPTSTQLNWAPQVSNWGINQVSFTAQDSYGDQTIHNYSYIVNTLPVFTSTPSNTTARAGQLYSYTITVNDPDLPYGDQLDITAAGLPSWLTLTDNHNGTATLSGTPTIADAGTVAVHLHAEDIYHHGYGGHVSQQFNIQVIACTSNVITRNINVNLSAAGTATITAASVNNGSTDDCGIQSLTVSPSSFTCANRGPNTVTLTLTNIYGTVTTKTAIVNVRDVTAPTLQVPGPVFVTAPAGQCSINATSVNIGNATATDACGPVTVSNNAPSVYPVGSTPITWTAVDAAGNGVVRYQVVIVSNNDAPVLAATPAVSATNDAGACGAAITVATPSATTTCATTECFTDNIDSYTVGNVSGQSPRWIPWFGMGAPSAQVTTARSFSAPNSVFVSDEQDQLYLLGDKSSGKWNLSWKMYIPAGKAGYFNTQHFQTPSIEWGQQTNFNTDGTGSLQADGALTPFTYPQGQWFDVKQTFDLDADQTALFINGVAVRTWKFSKQANNNPGAKQLGSIDFYAYPIGVSEYYIDDISFCGGNTPVVTGSRNDSLPLTATYPVGTTTITWTAVDGAGHTTSSTQAVTVTDNEAPVIICATIAQPICYTGSGSYSIAPLTASDNCGISATSFTVSGATTRSGSGNNASGTFNVGTSTITWTVTDIHGNTSTCTTTVVINAPVSATIANVYAVSPGGNPNTIYTGYGPSSLTITATPAGGTAPYTYQWSTGATTASITVSAAGTYSVVVKDSYGCIAATASKTIQVTDVRCGNKNDKVLVCQKTGSASNPWVQICIAPSAVATHLANGSTLGNCPTGSVTTREGAVKPAAAVIEAIVMAYPNPSRGNVNLQLRNFAAGKVTIQLVDANGKAVMTQQDNISYKTEDVTLSSSHLPAGVYNVKVSSATGVQYTKVVIVR